MKNKINHRREVSHKVLMKAIYDLHGCKATWIESVPVKEGFEGETVWEGMVQVFDLKNHPKAFFVMHGLTNWIIQRKGVFLRCFIKEP